MKLFRKIITTILVFIILMLSLTACSTEKTNGVLNEVTLGLWDRFLLDEKTHNIIEFVDDETIKYQGSKYYLAPMTFIQDSAKSVEEERGYEYICWTGPRFFYINTYYGDSKDSPIILYETRLGYTYFREDYDYKTDMFKIEGTENVICFGEDLIETDYKDMNYSAKDISLSSSTHTSLDIKLGIFFDNGVWYAYTMDLVYFELSENFIEILIKNQIIN